MSTKVLKKCRLHIDYLYGHLYHFRDNVTRLEVDLILEFSDGKCSAVVRDPETGIYIVPINSLKP